MAVASSTSPHQWPHHDHDYSYDCDRNRDHRTYRHLQHQTSNQVLASSSSSSRDRKQQLSRSPQRERMGSPCSSIFGDVPQEGPFPLANGGAALAGLAPRVEVAQRRKPGTSASLVSPAKLDDELQAKSSKIRSAATPPVPKKIVVSSSPTARRRHARKGNSDRPCEEVHLYPQTLSSTSPLDFFLDQCSVAPCNGEVVEEAPPLEGSELVTRTFHWRPEDFQLEVATYMQCDQPWEANGFKTGKGMSHKLMQVGADEIGCEQDEEDFDPSRNVGITFEGSEAASPSPLSSRRAAVAAAAADAIAAVKHTADIDEPFDPNTYSSPANAQKAEAAASLSDWAELPWNESGVPGSAVATTAAAAAMEAATAARTTSRPAATSRTHLPAPLSPQQHRSHQPLNPPQFPSPFPSPSSASTFSLANVRLTLPKPLAAGRNTATLQPVRAPHGASATAAPDANATATHSRPKPGPIDPPMDNPLATQLPQVIGGICSQLQLPHSPDHDSGVPTQMEAQSASGASASASNPSGLDKVNSISAGTSRSTATFMHPDPPTSALLEDIVARELDALPTRGTGPGAAASSSGFADCAAPVASEQSLPVAAPAAPAATSASTAVAEEPAQAKAEGEVSETEAAAVAAEPAEPTTAATVPDERPAPPPLSVSSGPYEALGSNDERKANEEKSELNEVRSLICSNSQDIQQAREAQRASEIANSTGSTGGAPAENEVQVNALQQQVLSQAEEIKRLREALAAMTLKASEGGCTVQLQF